MYVGDGVFLLFEELGDAVGSRCGVVSADGYQQLDVVVREEFKVEILVEVLLRGFETAHLQERTAAVEDVVCHGVVDVHHAGCGVEQSGVTLVQTDYAVAFLQKCLGDAAHNRIHARCGAAARKYRNSVFHKYFGFEFKMSRWFFRIQRYDFLKYF